LKNYSNPMTVVFTDRVSTGGNAIAFVRSSVCPSVSTLIFEPSDL